MRLQHLFEYRDANNDDDLRRVFDKLKPEFERLTHQHGFTRALDKLVHNHPEKRNDIVHLTMDFKDLIKTEEVEEALEDFNYDMVQTVMDMYDVGPDVAHELVNRLQDVDGGKLAELLTNDDKRGLAQWYTDIKNGLEEGVAWGRSGNKVVKKFRCSGGPRHGRVVSKPGQCFAPPDIKKRMKLKQTKAAKGRKMARKRKKTMKTNAASKRVQNLNRK